MRHETLRQVGWSADTSAGPVQAFRVYESEHGQLWAEDEERGTLCDFIGSYAAIFPTAAIAVEMTADAMSPAGEE